MRCEELRVWHRAMELTTRIAKDLQFARGEGSLASQMRRAAVSVVSNISEGAERDGDAEFAQFLAIAMGSCAEVQTQLRIGMRIGALSGNDVVSVLEEAQRVGFMVRALRRTVLARVSR